MNVAAKKYLWNFGISMTLYSVAVVGVMPVANDPTLPQWASILIVITPMIPALMALRAVLTFYRSMDELNKRIQSEAVMISFLITGMLSFAYGFVELVGFPKLPVIMIFPFAIAMWGISLIFVVRRYR